MLLGRARASGATHQSERRSDVLSWIGRRRGRPRFVNIIAEGAVKRSPRTTSHTKNGYAENYSKPSRVGYLF